MAYSTQQRTAIWRVLKKTNKELIYLDPETNRRETEDSYLFGNVRETLTVAQRAAQDDPRFQ